VGCLSRAYLTAYLLAASSERAENAVMRALDSWDPKHTGAAALLNRAVSFVVQESGPRPAAEEPSRLNMPPALRRVLRLPRAQRRCYVLRILLGWPAQVCSRLLGVDVEEVDECTCAALRALPLM
jgi:hypothetical protein